LEVRFRLRTVTQLPPDAGRRLRKIRRDKEIGVAPLARRLGYDRTTLFFYESGKLPLRPLMAALLLAALEEQPNPAEWPPVVCKLVDTLTTDELLSLLGRDRDSAGAVA
jgi:transcriptional regulator with XRE-family HTH domain